MNHKHSSTAHPSWLRVATSPDQLKRSLMVSIVVGTILTVINQGFWNCVSFDLNWTNVLLTYLVPFCVATYTATCTRLALLETKDKKGSN